MKSKIKELLNKIKDEKCFIQTVKKEDYIGHAILFKNVSCPLSFLERFLEDEDIGIEDIDLIPYIKNTDMKDNTGWKLYEIEEIKDCVSSAYEELKEKNNKIKLIKKIAEEKGINISDFLKDI
jgi:hypothetical protein